MVLGIMFFVCRLFFCFVLFGAAYAYAEGALVGVNVVAISAVDDSAVIMLEDEKDVKVIEVGDVVNEHFHVTNILPGKVVFKEYSEFQTNGDIYWVYQASAGNVSKIQHFAIRYSEEMPAQLIGKTTGSPKGTGESEEGVTLKMSSAQKSSKQN